ncbi:MAG: MgtC/SapB family protein [Oscillospiraceae bacterium]|nr:MgtC/SapB family protein [Oscillospiraceae bacterium]
MPLAKFLTEHFTLAQHLELFVRMILACACGAIIGTERSRRFKEAGIRTHILVCCGAALFMIVSKYGFADLTALDGSVFSGTRGADPARVAAQVVSGISFLGAGVIFKNGGTIKGLSTAAGLWVTAGIGLATGAGMYLIAFFVTVIVSLMQFLTHRFAIGSDSYAANRLQFTVKNGYEFNQSLHKQLDEWGVQVTDSKVNRRKDGTTDYDLTVLRPKEITYAEMKTFMDAHEEVLSASNNPIR